jgi:hypothetical protein
MLLERQVGEVARVENRLAYYDDWPLDYLVLVEVQEGCWGQKTGSFDVVGMEDKLLVEMTCWG